ncbi:MAG TPA: hypothetical protein VK992_05550 [Candidatus Caenarcaniphilales bacterium]|nr:hypothetical protein [Candidatus Caenarcaniphilales bacterium]
MTEQYLGWALVVGIAVGASLVWFVVGRLPRRSDDVGDEERAEEARWISRVIEARGGLAPPELVDEVLELHAQYLDGPPLEVRPDARPVAPLVPADDVDAERADRAVAVSELGDREPAYAERADEQLAEREVAASELADENRRAS